MLIYKKNGRREGVVGETVGFPTRFPLLPLPFIGRLF